MTSGQLIDALKSGKVLRRDTNKNGEGEWEYIQSYKQGSMKFFINGWGSAFGTSIDRIEHIINFPEQWEICNKALNPTKP